MAAGEEEVEESAEGEDVRGGRHPLTEDLLRRGEGRREGAPRLPRHRGRGAVLAIPLEELGDAEVEQLHPALRRHHDVRRLQVAMDDEVRVGIGRRGEHVEKEPYAGRDVEGAVVAPVVDRLAGDVFENQVGLAGRRRPQRRSAGRCGGA